MWMNKLKSPAARIFRTTLLLLLLVGLSPNMFAGAGDVDLSFDPGSGVNGEVKAMALQADGKLIIGGTFTTVRGLARANLARLNSDGSGDATFNAGTNADQSISAIALQSDGKVIFTRAGPNSQGHKVVRLNTNGTLDTSFVGAFYSLLYSNAYCRRLFHKIGVVVGLLSIDAAQYQWKSRYQFPRRRWQRRDSDIHRAATRWQDACRWLV